MASFSNERSSCFQVVHFIFKQQRQSLAFPSEGHILNNDVLELDVHHMD